MKFVDLDQQYQRISNNINDRIREVLNHKKYVLGPETEELEQRLAEFVGVKHCITASSGTLALQLALMSLGVGPGDEVITTPFSFFATAETILLLGATPVFVDIDPRTYNLNPLLIEAALTQRTKVILPVSLYGQCADFSVINEIAEDYGLSVIEDAAQSFGATYQDRFSCSLSTIGCTSFFPSKPLGAYGDGGACFTNDDLLAEKIRMMRHHGQQHRYHHELIGTNARLDTLQAAILLCKLDIFSEEFKQRQVVANWYSRKLKGQVITPYISPENISSYAQYTVQVDSRDEVQAMLSLRHIPTAVHYPIPLHGQPAVKSRVRVDRNYPEAEMAANRVLSLPFHPYLSEADVEKVTTELLEIVTHTHAYV